MKIYISADIEGITGVTSWSETEIGKDGYSKYSEQMTKEVIAACLGAIEAGATEIVVKDAHDSGRNIDGAALPKEVTLIRGWSGHPFSMVDGLDASFDGAVFIGYHSHSGSSGNPLAHTMNPSLINTIKINDEFASEFTINFYAAALVGVPVLFVSGDKGLVLDINKNHKDIITLGVKEGVGASTRNIHPEESLKRTKEGVYNSLNREYKKNIIELPSSFKVEIDFMNPIKAYKASFYPGMEMISSKTLVFKADDFFKVLTMILFIM